MSIGITLLGILYWILAITADMSMITLIIMIFSLLPLLLLWILVYIRFFTTLKSQKYVYRQLLTWIESIIAIGMMCTAGMTLLMRVFEGECSSLNFFHVWACNPGNSVSIISDSLLAALSLLPIFILNSFTVFILSYYLIMYINWEYHRYFHFILCQSNIINCSICGLYIN